MWIPQLSYRDNKLIELYDKYLKVLEIESRDKLDYEFFKGSQWPAKAALSKMRHQESIEKREEIFKELVNFAREENK